LESLAAEIQREDSFVMEDEEIGKTYQFHKRKGKLVDFLDILLQTRVRKKLRHTAMEQDRQMKTFQLFIAFKLGHQWCWIE